MFGIYSKAKLTKKKGVVYMFGIYKDGLVVGRGEVRSGEIRKEWVQFSFTLKN